MCLLVAAWRAHPVFRLVLAANRDEFHGRAAAPAHPWDDPPGFLAGRDLLAGGTWLGVDRRSRWGVITNFRELVRPRAGAPSRGELIPGFVTEAEPAGRFLARLEESAEAYAGFNLFVGDGDELWYASNRAAPFAQRLQPGVYGLSNHFLDTPWPKLEATRRRMHAALREAHARPGDVPALTTALLDALSDRTRVSAPDLPPTGLAPQWEEIVSSPFVFHPEYGTRCSTVLLLDGAGGGRFLERRFGADGVTLGEAEFQLNGEGWEPSRGAGL